MRRSNSWDRVIAVNQTGVFLGMRAVLPGMRAQKSGSIINVSSIWGVAAVPGAAAYHATKAAVRHLTKHVAVTYAVDNVRANSVHPGIIATPMVLVDQAEETSAAVVRATPLGRMGQPIELAQGMLFLASDASSFMTGAELIIDGGYLASRPHCQDAFSLMVRAYPKRSISNSVRTRTFRAGCCPGGRTTKSPAVGGG